MANEDLNISASELKASAGAADILVTDLKPVLKKAIDDTASATASLSAWPVRSRLDATGTGWGDALTTLQGRLGRHAEGLRLLADQLMASAPPTRAIGPHISPSSATVTVPPLSVPPMPVGPGSAPMTWWSWGAPA